MSLHRIAIAAACAATLGTAAIAAGSDDSNPPKKTKTSTQCQNGQIWDEKKQACVNAQDSRLNDDIRYEAARELAYGGQYENALKILAAADNPDDPRILNYKGFANRKAGRVDLAMTYYRMALSLDPDYILARSYMGQALVDQGDIAGARDQLFEIRARGGRDSWAYAALKMSLQGSASY